MVLLVYGLVKRRLLTDQQLELLRWIDAGCPGQAASEPQRVSARALSHRDMVRITGRGPTWTAAITPTGKFYLETGDYPAGHALAKKPPGRPSAVPRPIEQPEPEPVRARGEWAIDSPAAVRSSGRQPSGDALFDGPASDPWDEKVFVTVKEAAWMLSLPESAIREAVLDGNLDRVFIGKGTKNYRIVYGSLLAWVNDMPHEPADRRRYGWYR